MRRNGSWRIGLAVCAVMVLWACLDDAAMAAERRRRPRFDKRIGQGQIIAIIDGQPERALKRCQACLEADPNHLESLFNLTVAYCRLKDSEKAVAAMQRAVAAGLPPERLIAGPRDLLAPLAETAEFR